MKHSLTLAAILAMVGALAGCAARSDVEIVAPDVALNTLNPMLPPLAAALPKNPGANSFVVTTRVVPDANRPREWIPKSLIYNRQNKTLEYHHDSPFYEIFSGVNDQILIRVAAKKGGVRLLLVAGCKRSFQKEK